MLKISAELKFERARKKLADALKELDETFQAKLQEASNQTKLLEVDEDSFGDLQSRIVQQSTAIANLTSEINRLQNSLAEADKEADFTKEKNRALSQRFAEFRGKQKSLIEAIESDLTRLEQKIDGGENHDL